MGSINLTGLLMGTQNNNVGSINNKEINNKEINNSKKDNNQFKQILNTTTEKSRDIENKKNEGIKLNKTNDNTISLKEKSSVKKEKSSTRNKVSDNFSEIENEDTDKKNVDEAILSILSQELQLPLEEIVNTLDELGLVPIDLLAEGQFGDFMAALYQEQSPEDLLMGNTAIKDISKLFSKLQEFADESIDNKLHELLQQEAQLGETISNITDGLENLEHPHLEIQEMSSMGNQKEEKPPVLHETTMATSTTFMESVHSQHALGMTVPIESFKTSIKLGNEGYHPTHLNSGSEVIVKPHLNISAQILDHIEVTKLEQMQEIKMQLTPKELGQLTIKMTEKNGTLVAEIKVESEKTKDFVLNELDTLKERLTEQGIDVGHVQVDVRQNDGATQMQQQRQKSSKRIQEIIQKHLDELEAEEAEIVDAVKASVSDSEVDYMV